MPSKTKAEPDWLECLANEVPKCPYCGYDDDEWWDGPPHTSRYSWDQECPGCGKTFHVEAEESITFTTEKSEVPNGN